MRCGYARRRMTNRARPFEQLPQVFMGSGTRTGGNQIPRVLPLSGHLGSSPVRCAQLDGRQYHLRDVVGARASARMIGSSLLKWACTYRIANFSLGGPDIGKGPADPGYPPTSLRPTGLEARPLCQGRSRLSNSGRRRHPLFSTLCPCKDKTGRGCFARALAKPLPVSRRRPGLSRGTVAVGAGGCPSRRP